MDYPILTINDVDWKELFYHPKTVYKIGNNGGVHSKVVDMLCAFDIETSTLPEDLTGPDDHIAFMYIWQFCIKDKFVVVGRTWEEFITMIDQISKALRKNRLVIYIHNLSFEFSYLKSYFKMKPDDVFCMDNRKILSARIKENIELRCSYLLTNCSLDQWCLDCKPEHMKTTLKYETIRYPWTRLTKKELEYCVNDVICLVECLEIELRKRGDTLATIPKTATGFVRREVKRTMRTVGGWYKKMLPDLDVYKLLRSEFRGGNTHASRFFAGHIMENVHSYDISSSYPTQMTLSDRFPMSPFRPLADKEDLEKRMSEGDCVIFRCIIRNVHIKPHKRVSVPYIAVANCEKYTCDVIDNGRMIEGSCLAVWNEIDWKIICDQYDFDEPEFICGYWAKSGPLPMALRVLIGHFYDVKTALKGVTSEEEPGAEERYSLYKEYINAIYGMTVQDPLKQTIIFMQDNPANEQFIDDGKSEEAKADKYLKNGWLPYQWGCWVCSLARERLQEAINLLDNSEDDETHFLYCDTDSVKFIGNVDFSELNKKYTKLCKEKMGKAYDRNGKVHYMGVFEDDGFYPRFLTLGAKKYFYEDEKGKVHLTVSGIPKTKGAAYLEKIGGLEAVHCGLRFPGDEIGKLMSVYNDHYDQTFKIDGHELRIQDNVCLVPSDYTLDLAIDYRDMLFTMTNFEEIAVALFLQKEYNAYIGG